jgi:xanthine dehydrogenase YagS FAD-binding subunit
MKPFTYVKVGTPAEALKAIKDAGPDARFLAGGTTLYDLMKLDVMSPSAVVDITGIRELSAINTSGQELVFGALAPMSRVAADPRVMVQYPALSESLWKAASQQLRNMASMGGNLLQRTRCAYFRGGETFPCNKRRPGSGCAAMDGADRGQALFGASEACNAVYPGDFAIALVAFGAEIDTISARGMRTVALEDLHLEPGQTPNVETILAPDELILRLRVPTTPLGRASTYHKIRDRESYAFALTSAAVAVQMDGNIVRDARIALGGVATRPWRVRKAEQALIGQEFTAAAARRAGEVAFEGARKGHHNGFRIELGTRTVEDALVIARQRAVVKGVKA